MKIFIYLFTIMTFIFSQKIDDSTYIVKEGQTLTDIASELNLDAEDLGNWNNLMSLDLEVGQKLIITGEESSSLLNKNTISTNLEKAKELEAENKKLNFLEQQFIEEDLTKEPEQEVSKKNRIKTAKYFTATWCGPCKKFKPIMNEIKSEGYLIQFIDIDKNKALKQQYNVSSVPTTIIEENGVEIDRFIGALPKNQVIQKLNGSKNGQNDDFIIEKSPELAQTGELTTTQYIIAFAFLLLAFALDEAGVIDLGLDTETDSDSK
ncbi:MAG: LysM peptidoglycan-binding domain-containing protein [Rhodobiaceae bacterium]|nr:LysM peptidoglycan-binding domain-containing protein [Rhodobiaceae bacterium]